MCDYSLQHVRSRPAKVGDNLTTRDFGTRTRGFAAAEDRGVGVSFFRGPSSRFPARDAYRLPLRRRVEGGNTSSRDGNLPASELNEPMMHHDALDFRIGVLFC